MTAFNPVEAQQHIAEAKRQADELAERGTNGTGNLLTALASDLESAVEYIAGLERGLEATTNHYSRLLTRDDIKIDGLEAEVARLNGVITKAQLVEVKYGGDRTTLHTLTEFISDLDFVLSEARFPARTPAPTEPEKEN